MSFERASAYLDALGVDAMKRLRPSTQRIEAICAALDHPERSLPAIHVTGTNGKTSTARIASALLGATGLTVGTYTSPHLQSVRERIGRDGRSLSEDEFGEVFEHLWPYIELVERQLEERLSYFEVLTAMFFLWAAEAPVDVAVVEVGLGGTWDATNVVEAPVAVITNVGLDHTGLLGQTRAKIATEKAGIIKPGAVAVTAERAPDVLEVIERRVEEVGATISLVDRDFSVLNNTTALGGRYLSLKTSRRTYEDLFLPLHGAHQGTNAAVALEAVTRFIPANELAHDVVAHGLAGSVVRGRLEKVVHPGIDAAVVLDVAHNPDGISALTKSLIEAFAFDHVTFVVGILADKDYKGMLLELSRLPCSLIVTEPNNVRSVPAGDLIVAAHDIGLECRAVDDVAAAVDDAIAATSETGLVCVTGSHYVVGEARTHLLDAQEI